MTTPALRRTVQTPASASQASIRVLQRTHGNRAVGRLLQTKLTVGPVGDTYEQEADRIAKRVVKTPASADDTPAQRQPEEEEIQTKPLADTITPIARRQPEEEELQMQPIQRQPEEEELQMQPVQRQPEDEELQMSRPGPSAEGGPVSTNVEDAIQRAKGGGRPLAEGLRTKMESGFGADFGAVRVHDDTRADKLNQSLNARAFTTGKDIFFKQGAYDPNSNEGQELVAHELTHVVQQTGTK